MEDNFKGWTSANQRVTGNIMAEEFLSDLISKKNLSFLYNEEPLETREGEIEEC